MVVRKVPNLFSNGQHRSDQGSHHLPLVGRAGCRFPGIRDRCRSEISKNRYSRYWIGDVWSVGRSAYFLNLARLAKIVYKINLYQWFW